MGMIINGQWCEDDEGEMRDGAYVRARSALRRQITRANIAELSSGKRTPILVASASCPWSHAVVLLRAIKQLETILPLQMAVGPRVEGYALQRKGPLTTIGGQELAHVHQLYTYGEAAFTVKSTVPLLWDTRHDQVISNDSSKILRALDQIDTPDGSTLIPAHLRAPIDLLNNKIREGLDNAVYRAGLAQVQHAYDDAVTQVFATLDGLDDRLKDQRLLFGTLLMEADIRLFATLVRFDTVYATHFRCTRSRLTDYRNIWAYTRDLYQLKPFSNTVDFDAILAGYYLNDGDHNPFDIIAEHPLNDWDEPSNRERLGPLQIWSRENLTAANLSG